MYIKETRNLQKGLLAQMKAYVILMKKLALLCGKDYHEDQEVFNSPRQILTLLNKVPGY